MNRKQMHEALALGVSPLELSITKWEKIRYGKGKDQGASNCALCQVYNSSVLECQNAELELCPIRLAQPDYPEGCCEQYDTFKSRQEKGADKSSMIEAVDALIDFLKSLRLKKGAKT